MMDFVYFHLCHPSDHRLSSTDEEAKADTNRLEPSWTQVGAVSQECPAWSPLVRTRTDLRVCLDAGVPVQVGTHTRPQSLPAVLVLLRSLAEP